MDIRIMAYEASFDAKLYNFVFKWVAQNGN